MLLRENFTGNLLLRLIFHLIFRLGIFYSTGLASTTMTLAAFRIYRVRVARLCIERSVTDRQGGRHDHDNDDNDDRSGADLSNLRENMRVLQRR